MPTSNKALVMSTCAKNGTLLRPSYPLTPIEPVLTLQDGWAPTPKCKAKPKPAPPCPHPQPAPHVWATYTAVKSSSSSSARSAVVAGVAGAAGAAGVAGVAGGGGGATAVLHAATNNGADVYFTVVGYMNPPAGKDSWPSNYSKPITVKEHHLSTMIDLDHMPTPGGFSGKRALITSTPDHFYC